MDVAVAASYFDDTVCVDPFNPAFTIRGQLDLFDDSRRDGPTVSRRILSVAPGTLMPPGRVLTIAGDEWIVGMQESDTFFGDVIRSKYIVHRADGPALIQTPAEVTGSGGVTTYGARIWIKDMKELEVSSDFEGFYNVYLPLVVSAIEGYVVSLDNEIFRVRNHYKSAAGFLVAESDRVGASDQQTEVSATYTERTYSPALDAFTDSAPVALTVLFFRWQVDFQHSNESALPYDAGDAKAVVAKTQLATPAVGAKVVVAGKGTYQIVSVDDEGTSWGLHLRPGAP